MAFVLADRVQETSVSPGGTGNLTLSGSGVPGYKSFTLGIGTGNSFYYTIYDPVTYAWEVGIGSWTANVLTRTTVLSNSLNTTAAVSFTNGNTLYVWVDYPASSAVTQADVGYAANQIPLNQFLGSMAYQSSNAVAVTGGSVSGSVINSSTIGATTPATGAFTTLSSTSDATINGQTVGKGGGAVATNTAGGFSSLAANTSGATNVAVGYQTLNANTTGAANVAVGSQALLVNTAGSSNTAIGNTALAAHTISNTVAVGNGAMNKNTTGDFNTAVGFQTMFNNLTGRQNAAFGYLAMIANTTGAQNAAFGYLSLSSNTTGAQNAAIGYTALNSNTTGSYNTGVGGGDVGGFAPLNYNTTGGLNTAVGAGALTFNTTSSSLTAVGYNALRYNTTNVATLGAVTGGTGYTDGTYAGVVMTRSSGSTAFTYPTATIVVAGGVVSTVTVTSSGIGFKDTTTVLTAPAASIGGTGSGFTVPVATLKNGTLNTAFGQDALLNLTTASNCTAIGHTSGSAITTGNNNTVLGYQAGNTLTTGANNTLVGYQAAASSATVSNEITLGNSSVTSFRIPALTITAGAKWINVGSSTVALLPAAATAGLGARAFVTDGLAPTFGTTVAGGGAIATLVYSDGTLWKVG